MRYAHAQSLTPRAAATAARHIGRCPGFIDEDQPFRIETGLIGLPSGARRSDVGLRSRDDYLADGRDGSGSVRYRATNPVLGLTLHATDNLNLYANYGKGFETPTLAEAAYTVSGTSVVGTFNTRLAAARSRHLEAGAKWAPSRATRIDLAVFRIDTEDEIVSVLSSGGRTAFANATSTLREGLELSLRQALALSAAAALASVSGGAFADRLVTQKSAIFSPKPGHDTPADDDDMRVRTIKWPLASSTTVPVYLFVPAPGPAVPGV